VALLAAMIMAIGVAWVAHADDDDDDDDDGGPSSISVESWPPTELSWPPLTASTDGPDKEAPPAVKVP
jgi:hypothetical protein